MDRKSVIICGICFLLMLAWGPLVNNVLYPVEERKTIANTNRVDEAQVDLTGVTSEPSAAPSLEAGGSPVPVPEEPQLAGAVRDVAAVTLDRETEFALYRLSNLGGGIELVDLLRYPNDTGCNRSGDESRPDSQFAQLNPWASLPILGLRLGESTRVVGYAVDEEADAVRFQATLESGLAIEKVFTFGTNYLVHATTSIRNTTDGPVTLPTQYWGIGTSTPMAPEDNGILMGLMYHDGDEVERIKESWFANRTLGCFPGQPRTNFSYGETPVSWGSVDNQFFTMALIPKQPADSIVATQPPLQFSESERLRYTIKKGFHAELGYREQVLQPGESVEREFEIFAGPKEYNTLARLSSQFGNELDGIMDFDGFFGFFAKALLLSMNGLNGFGLSYGLSIVVITFIIKVLFWPLTQASTRSMKRMAALQPQMKEIQEKYKDDPQKMNRKLMEFMRENRVSPLGGCLPILLQLPVFFGFYTMLQSAIELRGASFLWTCDLSMPDTLFVIPGLGIPFNLLPLLMGASQIWQMSMTPPSPGMDPAQQKIMKYMPLMFVFILYNFSAGLALYWTVQNLLSIVQMKLTKNEPLPVSSGAPSTQRKRKPKGKRGRPGL